MREIPLTDGKVALVDDEDYDWISQWCWRFYDLAGGYAARVENSRWILMHRVIMQAGKGVLIGHRNGNTLDNRRANLYRADRSSAGSQQRIRAGGKSRHKGVVWDAASKRWRALVKVRGRRMHLGYFEDEDEAARAYDAAALQHFGPAATTNFKEGDGLP